MKYVTPALTRYGTMKSITRGARGSELDDRNDMPKAGDPKKDVNVADPKTNDWNWADDDDSDASNPKGTNTTDDADVPVTGDPGDPKDIDA